MLIQVDIPLNVLYNVNMKSNEIEIHLKKTIRTPQDALRAFILYYADNNKRKCARILSISPPTIYFFLKDGAKIPLRVALKIHEETCGLINLRMLKPELTEFL